MEKQITFTAIDKEVNDFANGKDILKEVKDWALMPLEWLRRYYSGVMGKEVSNGKMWLIIQAQLALFATLFVLNESFVAKIGFALWFGWSVWRCKE